MSITTPNNRYPDGKDAFHDRIALVLCVVIFFVWSYILINKFIDFGYYDWDLALYANAMWNLSHGSVHASLFGTNFLTNHAEYISFFLIPIYLIFPSAFTLIILNLFSFIAGSFVFYLIAKRVLGGPMAILLMLMYQFHPANLFMIIYEFHFESLAIIFIFLMFYFFSRERLIPFLVSAFFAMLCKENIPPIVFMFGIYAIFTKRPRKAALGPATIGVGEPRHWRAAWVMGPLILGGGVFILEMFVITPHLRMLEGIPGANQYLGLYWDHHDKTAPLTNVLGQNLGTAWRCFNSPLNRDFIGQLFGAFNILPFLSPHILFLGLPVFLQNFFSSVDAMHSIRFHYAATMMPFIFLAVMTTLGELKELKNRFRSIFYRLILILLATYSFQGGVYLPQIKGRMVEWPDRLDPIRWQMVNTISKEASVVATFEFLDKLSSRRDIYPFYNVWQNSNVFTGRSPYRLPENLSTALIDWECRWLWGTVQESNADRTKEILRRLSDFYFKEGWQVKNAVEKIVLLEKNEESRLPPLVEVSRNPPPEPLSNPPLVVDNQFLLLNFAVDQQNSLSSATVPLTFLWKVERDINDLYGMVIELKKERKTIFRWYRHLGYAVYATPLWKKGEYIKEHYWLLPPPLSPGEYAFFISLVNMSKQRAVPLTYQNQSGEAVSVMTFRIHSGKEAE